ncbi:MAG: hypothetical protein ABJH04_00455 [Cyclobacteriaceae bacterium]
MSQFDLVEDYLTQRMDDGARSAFEEQMNADPQLKAEVNLQKGIIEGVKSARAAELKAMLNNVPVGGASSAITGKIAIATISAGILGTILYFGLKPTATEEINTPTEKITTEQPQTPTIETPAEQIETIAESIDAQPVESEKMEDNTSEVVKPKKIEKATPPNIDVLDLTEDINDNDNKEEAVAPKSANKPTLSASSIEVELDDSNKTYSFHYQFKDSRLALYGPFDSSLYEIIELNGTVHSVFLYYNNSYYHLDEKEHGITPLIMIRDSELLRKLEEYRKKN